MFYFSGCATAQIFRFLTRISILLYCLCLKRVIKEVRGSLQQTLITTNVNQQKKK